MNKPRNLTLLLVMLSAISLACSTTDLAREMLGRLATPTSASEETSLTIWYVAPDGDDANSCRFPSEPCQTIGGAATKADDDDVIEIGPGTYRESSSIAAAGVFVDGKSLTLQGAGTEATFLEPEFPFHAAVVLRNGTFRLSQLTLQGGRETAGTGLNASRVNLTLSDVIIQDNEGRGFIVQDPTTTFEFTNITVRRNGVENWVQGEGSIRASRFLDNQGTALGNGGVLTLTDTLIEGNRAESGPGIRNYRDATLTVERSLIAHNTATASTHSRDLGIRNEGTLTLINSTVSNNAPGPDGSGSAIGNHGDLTLIHTTVADNRGTGVAGYGGPIIFENALIAKNDRHDCWMPGGEKTFLGTTLDTDDSCVRWFSSDRSSRDLFLQPLADNGGPTMTHALLAESPALDAATGECPETDQRGEARPMGPACDIGAFELVATTMSLPEAPEMATVTPEITSTSEAAPTPPLIVVDTLCWRGPGAGYEVVSALSAGTEVEILGRGIEGDWWVIDNPRYQGVPCWAPGEDIEVDANYTYPTTLFEIPPLPTATPAEGPEIEGCLYQGPNDNVAVCYPIGQCPVDFEDSEGACKP